MNSLTAQTEREVVYIVGNFDKLAIVYLEMVCAVLPTILRRWRLGACRRYVARAVTSNSRAPVDRGIAVRSSGYVAHGSHVAVPGAQQGAPRGQV